MAPPDGGDCMCAEREEPGQPLAAHDAALLAVCQQFYNTRARVFLLALKKIARAQIALDIAEADRIHIETVRWVRLRRDYDITIPLKSSLPPSCAPAMPLSACDFRHAKLHFTLPSLGS